MLDRLTKVISTTLGEIIYGDGYMQTVDSMIGDPSWKFYINMHLSYSLLTVLVLGIVLYISSHKEMV